MKTPNSSQAPAKVMIAGEYSVLFGGLAIVAAVDRFAKARFKPSTTTRFFRGDLVENDNPLWLAINEAAALKEIVPAIGDYSLNTEEFFAKEGHIKYGLGSSAAGIVALCRLLLAQKANKNQLHDLALVANKIFSQGLGSGADIAASAESRAILFRLLDNHCHIEHAALESLWPHLIFIFTNRQQNSRPFVAKALEFAKKDSKYIESFKAQSDNLCTLLLSEENSSNITEIINECYHLLFALGKQAHIDIISSEHQEIFRIARNYQGCAKPSGAGGGDLCVAYIPEQTRFIKDCLERGFSSLELELLV